MEEGEKGKMIQDAIEGKLVVKGSRLLSLSSCNVSN